MKIDGIVCCVGEYYREQLANALPIWLETLDSITVVTKPNDYKFKGSGLKCITTDVFTKFGAYLNKGAALCYAFAAANPKDWVLHFDADIIPPKNWRYQVEQRIQPGHLYGVRRYPQRRVPHDRDQRFCPFGYFQLWDSNDLRTWFWPIYDTWHPHCGSYDADFMDLWPSNRWKELPFSVIHQSEPRVNWFGEDGTHLMKPLLQRGLFKYRMMTRRGHGRIPIPKPKIKLSYDQSSDPKWIRELIRVAQLFGPFDVWIRARTQAIRWERVQDTTPILEIKNRIKAACR